ncbi:hypothetical protein RMN57_13050 [Kitasatospora sp. CM 4170]|uniref:DUF1918 domain-containing protein n=1 Tax=Kitasatospora aburaviensis TaxID=67265 RepID=A0ABW1F314_9ACTN|nr:hypothetical protein [Kitasatospora sp. CM 4170]WNM45581.1 hypothetical protein RMN57_13050 [Kitasatospora sp. CM 4170]
MSTPPRFALGDRVRTRIHLTSADWHPEQPDIPAGSLGTIDHIHPSGTRYGVMLDASVDRLSASMDADEIEAAGEGR